MYVVPTEVKTSSIDGRGVFSLNDIPQGTIVWKFESNHDKTLNVNEYNNSDKVIKQDLERIAFLSPTTNRYVYPPQDDPACFTNHNEDNNLDAIINTNVSPEPYFVANKNIAAGEELTNNYSQFDSAINFHKPDWIK